jgi:mevalonate kinase
VSTSAFHAFGKVILLGEHAVVYGVPALAAALSTGVTVETPPGTGRLRVPAWDLDVPPSVYEAGEDASAPTVAKAFAALEARLGVQPGARRPVDYVVRFAVPTGAGLGSSAAMAVALARAVAATHGIAATATDIEDAAMASETVVHGRPSGLDHTVSARGGFGVFVRGQGLAPVAARDPLPLVIGHTGRARDTKGRVARVAELVAGPNGDAVRARFDQIRALVERGRTAVELGGAAGLAALGEAMRENQRHLEALEVSCPEIETMCRIADDVGALGAKLTGGGGGGCVIALAPGREEILRNVWQRNGFTSFVTEIGARQKGQPS